MAFCPYCGTQSGEGWAHCASCGKQLPTGISVNPPPANTAPAPQAQPAPINGHMVVYRSPVKVRGTAALLAIFLSFWGLIYTYKKDAAIFWLLLVLSLVGGGLATASALPVKNGVYAHPEAFGWSYAIAGVVWLITLAFVTSRDYQSLNMFYAVNVQPKAQIAVAESDLVTCSSCGDRTSKYGGSCLTCGAFLLGAPSPPKFVD